MTSTTTNTSASTTLNVACFIIPNGLSTFGGMYFGDSFKDQCRKMGISEEYLSDDNLTFECWFTGEGEDNLSAHGWGERICGLLGLPYDPKHPTYDSLSAPARFPVALVKDLKEGDMLTFTAPTGVKINVTFEQMGHRYQRHGRFEALLADLIDDYNAWHKRASV